MLIIGLLVALMLLTGFAFAGRGWLAWGTAAAALFATWYVRGVASPLLLYGLLFATALVALATGLPPLRRVLFARALLPVLGKVMPRLGETERIALEAGTVWWDAQIFSGMPDWDALLRFECKPLSPREQAFLDGPVTKLRDALRAGRIDRAPESRLDEMALAAGIISREEYAALGESNEAHDAVVQVDAFDPATYKQLR